jgi:hypothetical protein
VAEIPLPADARRLSTLSRIDYADSFTVIDAGQRSPEKWVSAVLRDAPPRVRRRVVLGWTALGLKLGPPWSSDRVLGWKAQRSEPGFVLLAADSWFGFRGQLLFRTDPNGLLFATFVQQTNPAARVLWAAITPRHRRVIRALLTRAGRREPGLPGSGSVAGGYDRGSAGAA